MPTLPKLIAVVGPTASGKTSLGIALAQKFDGEIVSADSRQIYRGMDIGTAKASREELASVPHHLVDIRNPDEEYTVVDFKRDAVAAIDDIVARGKLPIVVGGTGLYVKSLLENLDIPKIKADPALRAAIEKDIAIEGLAAVFEKLVALDPEAAYIVDPKNPRRIVRALEVALITGKPFTAQRVKSEPRYNSLEIGINPPPDLLRERIDRRIDQMVADGLVNEVKNLLKKYQRTDSLAASQPSSLPIAFDAIGYREIIDHLAGRMALDEAVAAIKLNTWHFAKRQVTWFKKDKNIQWIAEPTEAIKICNNFLR
jgi:tRNA dimethylallyltransferase